ncbi:Multidrug resistance protein 3 [Leucoagaricus sp. SymC.cos]|nr:Multidrug resistance protein 3 [Leucoagaricus sp. SymC.cos]
MSQTNVSPNAGKSNVQVEPPKKAESYTTEQHGIWDILLVNEDYRKQLGRLFRDVPKSIPALRQLMQDIYSLSPVLFILFCASQLWSNCQTAINLHFSSELLRAIEHVLKDGASNPWFVGRSILARLLVQVSVGAMTCGQIGLNGSSKRLLSRMRTQIRCQFELRLMKGAEHQINVTSGQAWRAFEEILLFIGWLIDGLCQLTLIIHLSRRCGSPLFAILCIIKPLFSTLARPSLWDKICIMKQNNKNYARMEALTTLTKKEYRQDVIGGDLQDFILSEYQKASKSMGDISDDYPWILYQEFRSPWPNMVLNMLGDLPTFYCAILALVNPSSITFSSIAILQESSKSLAWFVEILVNRMEQSTEPINDATATPGGMGFELRNVSFGYPSSQITKKALRNINLTIQGGQFVVLVGSNGSGKSTLVKLLCRTLSGEILIDSLPVSSYTESSLRQSMAVLSQDNLIYPGLSLGENIGLGCTSLVNNHDAIMEAAKKAGADEVLKRMTDSADTVLDPMSNNFSFNVTGQEAGHPLKKVLKELRKPGAVSGGEKQKIVAARTFMRLRSGKIRCLVVDEPSSALDPEAEVTLFENLLKERGGVTIVTVTHQFGKLTRQADLIVCMKDGNIVESGTHAELMRSDGEYKKLYDLQASAFQEESSAT